MAIAFLCTDCVGSGCVGNNSVEISCVDTGRLNTDCVGPGDVGIVGVVKRGCFLS